MGTTAYERLFGTAGYPFSEQTLLGEELNRVDF